MPKTKKSNLQLKADLGLLFVALVWGITFVTVKNALSDIGPHLFNGIRFSIAFIFLSIVYFKKYKLFNKSNITAGVIIGIFLFGGYAFQTIGLKYTTASNAAFITGLSVVLVPLLSTLIFKKRPHFLSLIGALCAGAGLAFLTLKGTLAPNLGDLLVLLCAFGFASHITCVGHYSQKYDPVVLVLVQIGTVAVISLLIAVFTETIPSKITYQVWEALFITSIFATALAFLIQNKVQMYTSAVKTAIIFSMEPVFGALSAWLLLKEVLTVQQLFGAILIFLGMIIAELSEAKKDKSYPNNKKEMSQLGT